MTDAIAGIGLSFRIGDGGTPESFTEIAEVKDFTGPGLGQDTEDVTSHSSPGNWRERVPTLKDGGEVTFTLNWVPTDPTHDETTGILADLENQTQKRNFRAVWPDASGTTWEIPAIVTNFEPSDPVDGVLEAEVTLEVNGQPTFNV